MSRPLPTAEKPSYLLQDATFTTDKDAGTPSDPAASDTPPKNLRFWGIFAALCALSFLAALDSSIITTALLTITKDIGGGKQYIWIANSFVFATLAPQPMFGQIANLFNRRNPTIASVLLFVLGSGVAGGAHNVAMLIAGRTIQGIGAGGIYVLIDVVCCDMVSLRERGKYLGFMFSWAGVAALIGPVLGGAFAQANWRWIFYINLPISGVALVTIIVYLPSRRPASTQNALRRIDFAGNAIFIPSMISILFGLVMGGAHFPWGSWHIVVPLVLGGIGWISFHFHQASRFCKEPSVPTRLFSNRTSAAAYGLTFLSSVVVQQITYFLPVYLQAVKGSTPYRAGVQFLPFAGCVLFFAVIAGSLLSKTGQYRPLHWTACALSAVGFGIFTLLDDRSSKAAWVCFQVVAAGGSGLIMSGLLPAAMAALPETEVASATAVYSFLRTFGYVWGVTISSITFNGQFDRYLFEIQDLDLRSQLAGGGAYAFASEQAVQRLPEPTRAKVISVYIRSLNAVWQVGIALSVFSFLLVFVERHVELRQELETDFGIREENRKNSAESGKRGYSAPV
jgi:MFS family permease